MAASTIIALTVIFSECMMAAFIRRKAKPLKSPPASKDLDSKNSSMGSSTGLPDATARVQRLTTENAVLLPSPSTQAPSTPKSILTPPHGQNSSRQSTPRRVSFAPEPVIARKTPSSKNCCPRPGPKSRSLNPGSNTPNNTDSINKSPSATTSHETSTSEGDNLFKSYESPGNLDIIRTWKNLALVSPLSEDALDLLTEDSAAFPYESEMFSIAPKQGTPLANHSRETNI